MATELHQRERTLKAARGRILDRNGTVIADNRTVCTVSVVHNQIEEPEKVIGGSQQRALLFRLRNGTKRR